MASFKNLISNTSAQIASGGTITGDLVINGDLQVDGGGSLSFDEVIEGTQVIDVTNTEALLVRKNGDGGDVLIVDTTNSRIGIGGTPTESKLEVIGTSGELFKSGTVTNDWGANHAFGLVNGNGIMLSDMSGANNTASNRVMSFNRDDTNGHAIYVYDPSGNVDIALKANSDSYLNGGKVGIGTSNPSGKLTLSNGSASAPLSITASNSYIQLGSEDYGSGGLGKFMIGFGYTDTLTNTHSPAYIGFEETSTSGDTKGDLTFYTRNVVTDTAPTERLRIDETGNMGLGMSPSSRLSIKANGDTSTVLDIHGRSSDDYAIISFKENASQTVKGNIQVTGSDSMIFRTGPSTNALTLDSSQNASFAGNVDISSGKNINFSPTVYTSAVQGIKFDQDGGTADAIIQPVRVGDVGVLMYLGSNTFVNTSGGNDRYNDSEESAGIEVRHDGQIRFLTGGTGADPTEKMSINSDGSSSFAGNVDIGARVGTGLLEVKGSVDNDYAGRFENTHSGGYGALVKIAGTTANDLAFQVRAGSTNILTINGDSSATFAGTINTTLNSTGIIGDLKNSHASGYGLKIQATDANSARYIATFNDKDDNMKARIFGDGGATFSGDVAIGDSVPLARLHVQGSSSGAVQAFIINTNGGTNSSADLAFGTWSGAVPTGTGNPGPQAKISAINTDSGTASSDLAFSTYGSSGTSSEKMRITNDGNVGIGSTPKTHLDVQSYQADGITIGADNDANRTRTNSTSKSGGITGVHYTNAEESIRLIGYSSSSSANTLLIGGGNGDWNSATAINFYIGANTTTTSGDLRFKLDANSKISLSNNDSGGTSGADSTTGNTLLGAYAGLNIASGGNDNAFFGHASGNKNTTGEKNTGFGTFSGFGNRTGDYNTYVGYGAGFGVDNNNHSNNTAVGYNSLLSITTGDNNTIVGAFAGDALQGGADNTIIGANADASAVGGTNQIVIGHNTTGQGNNSVTLGNDDVTDIYMASDSGATVHCAGIKFDASGEVLGDYEEGTYTVTLTPSTSGSITVNSSYDTASYTKIGRQVTVTGAIDTSAISSPVGFIKVNVPFAIGANTELSHRASGSVVVYSASSNIQDYMVFADGGEAYFRIYLSTGTTLATTSAATIDASTSIAFTFTYFA